MLPTLLKIAGNLAFLGAMIDFLIVCVIVVEALGASSWTLMGVIGACGYVRGGRGRPAARGFLRGE